MATIFIGDIQGCCSALEGLLDKVRFDETLDRVILVGDLVNRGPDSAAVLQLIMSLGTAASTVLGNHDIHLLAVAAGAREQRPDDTFLDILEHPARESMIAYLKQQPVLLCDETTRSIVVHAGLWPGWNLTDAQRCAHEVEVALRDPGGAFFHQLYGDQPDRWDCSLRGWDRLRVLTNIFTRARYYHADGRLDFVEKGPPERASPALSPWFDLMGDALAPWRVIFGHWSSLGLVSRSGFIALDTGCAWGGTLTAVRFETKTDNIAFVSYACS